MRQRESEPVLEEVGEDELLVAGVRDYLTHDDPFVRELAKRVLANATPVEIKND